MQERTHISLALLIACVLLFFNTPPSVFLLALISSLIPDIDLLFAHRKLLHNLWMLVILTLLMSELCLSPLITFSFFLGYISHLLLDSLTPKGVRWLWPFNFFHVRGKIRNGSIEEKMLRTLFVISGGLILGVWIFKGFYQNASGFSILVLFIVMGIVLFEWVLNLFYRMISKILKTLMRLH